MRVASNGQLSYVQDLAFSGAATSFSFNPDANRIYVSFSGGGGSVALLLLLGLFGLIVIRRAKSEK